MHSHHRNRRMHPSHGRKDDDSSKQSKKELTCVPFSTGNDSHKNIHPVKPLNFGAPAPPPAFESYQFPPSVSSVTSATEPPRSGAFPHQSFHASTSQIGGRNSPSPSAVSPRDPQLPGQNQRNPNNYTRGNVERYTLQDPEEGLGPTHGMPPAASSAFAAYGGRKVSCPVQSPFEPPAVQAPWQHSNTLDVGFSGNGFGGLEAPTGTMNSRPSFPAKALFSWKGGFAQQMKEIGQFYASNSQEDDNIVDPPLLEELGIDLDDIVRHIKCVLLFRRCPTGELQYGDFTGPLLILMLFWLSMLLSCNFNFSLVYAIVVLGTGGMYFLFNLLSQDSYVDLSKIASILGYSLLPICLAPIIWLFSRFAKPVSAVLVYLCVAWSTSTASRLLTQELNMSSRKYLVIYPTFIYYMYFAHVAMM